MHISYDIASFLIWELQLVVQSQADRHGKARQGDPEIPKAYFWEASLSNLIDIKDILCASCWIYVKYIHTYIYIYL